MLKWVVILFACAMVYPLALVAKREPRLQLLLITLVGVLPFVGIDQLNFSLHAVEAYRGTAHGYEVATLDLITVALYFALPPRKWPSPYRAARWVYFAIACLSILAAPMPLYASFAVWKLLRVYLVLNVVSRACEDPKKARWLVYGFAIGIFYSFAIALNERYIQGAFQVKADFPHQNSLGMAVNLVFPIAVALLLAGQGGWTAAAMVGCSGLLIVFSLSRGSLGMFVFAMGVTFVGSLLRQITKRKVWVTLGFALAGVLVVAKSYDSIVERFETAPAASEAARVRFVKAAKAMHSDYPLGIGINQYSFVLSHKGYADRFGMPPIDRDGLCHQIYFLTLAELGWAGLLAYAWLIAVPWFWALRGAMLGKGDIRGDVLLGCFAGLSAMYLQGMLEWIARQIQMQYLFFMAAGLIATLYRQIRENRGLRV